MIRDNRVKAISKESAAHEALLKVAKLASEEEALRSFLALLNKHWDPPGEQPLSSNGCGAKILSEVEEAMDFGML